jgi:hypothetical protein
MAGAYAIADGLEGSRATGEWVAPALENTATLRHQREGRSRSAFAGTTV